MIIVSLFIIVAILFKYVHACLYGNQTINYFDIILPYNFFQALLVKDVLEKCR